MKVNINKIYIYIISAIALVVQISLLLVNARIAYYTTPYADDFYHASVIGVKKAGLIPLIKGSIHLVKERYYGWGGVYFANFIQGILGPLNGFGHRQMQIVMSGGVILLWICFFIALSMMLGKWNIPLYCSVLIQGISMFLLLFYRLFADVVTWFSGATSYTYPMIMLCITIILSESLEMDFSISKNRRISSLFCILGIICSFCMSGGALVVSGAGCYILLLGLLRSLINKKCIVVKALIFFSGVMGAVINAVAPGNYVRTGASGANSLDITFALINTLKIVLNEYIWLLRKGLGIAFIFILIVGMTLETQSKSNLKSMGIISLLGLVTPLIATFPCVLGYGTTDITTRTYFVIDLLILTSSLVFTLVVGMVGKTLLLAPLRTALLIVISSVTIVSFALDNDLAQTEKITLMQIRVLQDGSLAKYYDECVKLLGDLPNHVGEEVILEKTPMPTLGYYGFMVTPDIDNWLNVGIAQWYGLNSIRVE